MPVETTQDTFFEGKLTLIQPLDGYRSSIDALLLAYFASIGRASHQAIDLGAGCGIVGLSLLLMKHVKQVTAIEAQPELAELAKQNAALNEVDKQYTISIKDIRKLKDDSEIRHSFDLVITNPPFWPTTHRLPANPQRRIACHEVLGTLSDWIHAASQLVSYKRGRLVLIYPAQRTTLLLNTFAKVGFSTSKMMLVHPFPHKCAELILVEARPRKEGVMSILPPLFLKQADGTDTETLRRIVSGTFSEALSSLPDIRNIQLG